MTAAEFRAWLAAMKAAGRLSKRAWQRDAAALLGVHPKSVREFAEHGVPDQTAVRTRLACAALLAGLG